MNNNVTLNDEYGYVADGQVFLKGYLSYPDRRIGEVKKTEQEAIDYFKNRFKLAESKVDLLEKEIEEAQNKGSFLTKLIQLRKKLIEFDGLGDFPPLLNRLETAEVYLSDLIKNNQEKNLEIKNALINDGLELIAPEGDLEWNEVTDQLQELKAKWIRTGPVEKELQEELEVKFQDVLDIFFARRREYFSEQNKLIADRIERYNDLLAQSDALHRVRDVDEAQKLARALRNEWKEVGEIPIKRSAKLYKKFKRSQQRILDRYNRVKGIKVEQAPENPLVTKQREMCVEAERLARSTDIITASERAKVLLNLWKEVKLPPRVGDKMVAERFRSACDKIFELSYLERVLSRKYPAFDIRTEEDQLGIKIREMEWLIKREKGELELAISTAQDTQMDEDTAKQTMNRINIQRRKIAMKEKIVDEFKAKLG